VSRRRPDIAALAFGAIFVAAAVWWVLNHSFALDLPSLGWIVALVLIAVGALGIISVLRGDRRRDRDRRRDDSRPWQSKP
jgi:peptidoglycan biosynthesis protein MviN/MurJ (putative lipid II flippase)